MKSYSFFLLLLFAISCCRGAIENSTNSILLEYFDSKGSISDSQTISDLTRLRKLYGWLIRKCGQRIDKSLKRKTLSKIASLSSILMDSERLNAVIAACPVTAALVKVVEKLMPQADFSGAFGTPLKMLLFEEFFKHDNPLVMNDTIDEYLGELAQEVNEFRIGDFLNVEEIIFNAETGVNMSNVPSAFADSIKLFVGEYFDSINLSIKRNLMASLVESPPGSPIERALFKIVRECGPTLQKIFQLLMDEVKNENLSDLNAQFKTGTRCMSSKDFYQALIDALGGEDEFFAVFKAFDVRAVASATVAQGHLAVLTCGKPVFVKVKKFGIENHMRMDFDLMSRISQHNETYTGIYHILQQNIMGEMDWNKEVENMKIARQIYHKPEIGIHVPKVWGTWPAEKADLIVMERATGEVLIDFVASSKEKACTLIRLLSDFYRTWWDEAMFNSGFMHADPHSGNLIFEWDEEEPEDSKLWVLDYGNVKILEEDVRANIMELAVGVLIGDSESIANGLGRKRYPEHEELWNNLISGLNVFLQSPHLIPLSIDDKISQVMKHIAKQSQLPSAKDVVIFFRAKSLFDGLFKRLENEYGDKFRSYGCPVPKPNKLGALVAVSSFKNLKISLRNTKPAILKTLTSRIGQVPRILASILGKSTARESEKSETKTCNSKTTIISATITRRLSEISESKKRNVVINELSEESSHSSYSEQSGESICNDSNCSCKNASERDSRSKKGSERGSGSGNGSQCKRLSGTGSEPESEPKRKISNGIKEKEGSSSNSPQRNEENNNYHFAPLSESSSSSSIDANSKASSRSLFFTADSKGARIQAFVNGIVSIPDIESFYEEVSPKIPKEKSCLASEEEKENGTIPEERNIRQRELHEESSERESLRVHSGERESLRVHSGESESLRVHSGESESSEPKLWNTERHWIQRQPIREKGPIRHKRSARRRHVHLNKVKGSSSSQDSEKELCAAHDFLQRNRSPKASLLKK
jgi:predicted unusual protein kinase regulating ubiquinone biosynthesis (AarF/ABC1/UbiB family)